MANRPTSAPASPVASDSSVPSELSGPGIAQPMPAAAPVAEEDFRRIGLLLLSVLALVVGVVTGFGAVLFRDLIGFLHNVLFLGQFTMHYDANEFTPASPWGVLIILVPVAGGLVITFLVNKFAPEARGHGVPEVMDAIYYKSGLIRPVVAVVKSLASALAIGSGASVGREGPIIQIGSALGSTLGQVIHMPASQRIILVAAGAGSGIAATFNTPIGGVMFAIELMMPEVSARTFLPVALATGTATFIGRLFIGANPAFAVPALAPLPMDASSALTLCLYALLGVVVGVAAAAFVRGLHLFEDIFEKIHNTYLRHSLGMLLVGILMYSMLQMAGHYHTEGVGYATVQAILTGQIGGAWFLLVLFVAKLLATSLSLGSGSSGGVFSPSLFLGATVGGAFATGLIALGLPMPISVPSFAMVGMGATVGGGTGAVMTGVTMIFEMTRDYDIVMPMILAVAVAVGVRRLLSRENIYTLKLYRRGHTIPKALQANMFLVRRAREVMDTSVVLAPAEMSFDAFLASPNHHGRMRHVVVTDGRHIIGTVRVNTSLRQATQRQADAGGSVVRMRDVASRAYTIVREDAVVFDVIQRIWRRHATMAVVVRGRGIPRPDDVVGVITKEHVADSVASSVKVYAGGGSG